MFQVLTALLLSTSPELVEVKTARGVSEVELADAVRSRFDGLARCIAYRKQTEKPSLSPEQVRVTLTTVTASTQLVLQRDLELEVHAVSVASDPRCVEREMRSLKLPPSTLEAMNEAGRNAVTIVYRYQPTDAERTAQLKENTAGIAKLCDAFARSGHSEHPKKPYEKVRGSLTARMRALFDPTHAATIYVDAKTARFIFTEAYAEIAEELGVVTGCKALSAASP